MNRLSDGLFRCVVVGLFAGPAIGGGMTYDSDGRFVTLDSETAWFDDEGELRGHQSFFNTNAPVDYDHWVVDEENNSELISLAGTQDSFATSTEISASGMVQGSSRPEDGIEYLLYSGVGLSVCFFDFTISEQTSFELYADLFSDDSAGDSSVFLRGVNGTNFDFSVLVQQGQTLVDEDISLEAGSYRFALSAEIYIEPIESSVMGSFDGGLRVVPAPSGVFVLACGGLVGVRRRR